MASVSCLFLALYMLSDYGLCPGRFEFYIVSSFLGPAEVAWTVPMFFGGLFCSWVTVNPVGSDHSPFCHVWAVVQGHISALGPSCTHAAQEGAQGWVGSYVELGVPFPALSFLEFPHTCGLKEPLLCTLWLESQGGRQSVSVQSCTAGPTAGRRGDRREAKQQAPSALGRPRPSRASRQWRGSA